ncbi:MAG: hypothetical protein P3W93_000420 [Thermus sp.]|nr:hypothetical protein [Thermus sp.]
MRYSVDQIDETGRQLVEDVKRRVPPGTKVYLVWGRTPEELWETVVELSRAEGLSQPVLHQLGKVIAENGFNIIAFAQAQGDKLYLAGQRAQVMVPIKG